MSNIVPQQGGGVPMTAESLNDFYRQQADAYSSEERRGGNSISVRNMVMSVGDQAIPGNQMAAIVLDAVRLNTWYPDAFNPQNPLPPRCYAIGRTDADMAPHPDMAKAPEYFAPQSDKCSTCPLNQWGSGRDGKGKACTNRRRLLLLPAGTYQNGVLQPFLDPDHYASAVMLTLTLSPTMLPGWGEWVRNVAAQYQRPPFGVIARVYLHPHPKHGKEAVGFETLAPIPDDWAPVILARHREAAAAIFEGYEAPQAGQQPQQAQRGGGFYQQQAQRGGGFYQQQAQAQPMDPRWIPQS